MILHPSAVLAGAAVCDTTWNSTGTGTVGDWTDGTKWTGGVPDATDNVCLPVGAYTVIVDNTLTAVANTIAISFASKLQIGNGAATTLTVTSTVADDGTLQIGNAGAHPNAKLDIGTTGTLFVTSNGTFQTAGTGNELAASILNQGSFNPGSLALTKMGATISNSGTWTNANQINMDLGSASTFTMSDGSISGSQNFIMKGGTFDHTGGTVSKVTLDGVTLLPRSTAGAGTFIVTRLGNVLGSNISALETVVVAGGYVSEDGVLGSAVSRVNNGTIQLRSDGEPKTGKVIFTGGATLTNNGTILSTAVSGLNGNARVIEAPLINNGTININYDTAFDQASTTYIQNSGTTSVAAGTTLDLTGSNGTLALSGGTLSGGGTIKGQVNNHAGTVGPGSSPGILTVNGNFTQDASGTLTMEIGGTNAGVESDRLAVTGFVALDGTLALQKAAGFFPTTAFTYDFLSYSALGGSFGVVTGVNAGGGKSFVISLNATVGTLSVTAGPIARQPDGQIAIGTGTFIGNNIYNTDGMSQSKSKSTTAGKKVTFMIKLQNDGTGAKDKFTVHATGSSVTGLTIKYFKGTTNITTAVNNGTFQVTKVAPGSAVTIKAVVTVGSSAGHGANVTRLVTITSGNDTNQKDAVKLTAGRT